MITSVEEQNIDLQDNPSQPNFVEDNNILNDCLELKDV
jgi:hypothetical protein